MSLQVLHVLRALEYKAKEERVVVLSEMDDKIGQEPFNSPSVFNFYLPEYQPNGTHQLSERVYTFFMHVHLRAESAIFF